MLMRAQLPLLTILYELELAVYSENIEYHLIAKQRIHIFQTVPAFKLHLSGNIMCFAKSGTGAYFNYSQSIYAYLMVSKGLNAAMFVHNI